MIKKINRWLKRKTSPIYDLYYTNKNVLTFVPIQGLANRMKEIVSYIYKHNFNVDVLNLHWELGYMVNKHFSELFRIDNFKVNEINYSRQISLEVKRNNTWRLYVKNSELPKGFTTAFPKDDEHKEYIDFEYNRIPETIRDKYIHCFQLLQPSEIVLKRINTVTLPDNCVAVHIRLNKQWKDHNRGKQNDIQDFINAMNKEPKSVKFFLAACDDEVENEIRKMFPKRIIELQNKDNADNVDAVAELYLLSKPRKLIGSFGSTFTEVAWWLGDCKQEIEIIGKDWTKK